MSNNTAAFSLLSVLLSLAKNRKEIAINARKCATTYES